MRGDGVTLLKPPTSIGSTLENITGNTEGLRLGKNIIGFTISERQVILLVSLKKDKEV